MTKNESVMPKTTKTGESQMTWQAIDNASAPRDGTRVLLTDGKFVATGAWREIRSTFRRDMISKFQWDIDGERGDDCPWANDYMGDVIAWMPLPSPP